MKTIPELSRNTLLKKIALALKHVLKPKSPTWKNWLNSLENPSPLFLPSDVCLLQIFWSLFQLLRFLAQGGTTCAFGSFTLKMYVSVLMLRLEAALRLKCYQRNCRDSGTGSGAGPGPGVPSSIQNVRHMHVSHTHPSFSKCPSHNQNQCQEVKILKWGMRLSFDTFLHP